MTKQTQQDQEKVNRLIERVEKIREERAGLNADISEIFRAAKEDGFNVKALKHVIKMRAMSGDEREELDFDIAIYRKAAGIQSDLFADGFEDRAPVRTDGDDDGNQDGETGITGRYAEGASIDDGDGADGVDGEIGPVGVEGTTGNGTAGTMTQ